MKVAPRDRVGFRPIAEFGVRRVLHNPGAGPA